jgi:hypothetical protein
VLPYGRERHNRRPYSAAVRTGARGQRADLVASLKGAKARISAGEAMDYDPEAFKKRLIGIFRGYVL